MNRALRDLREQAQAVESRSRKLMTKIDTAEHNAQEIADCLRGRPQPRKDPNEDRRDQ